jgi:hypothetical protein|tara:strand:- start:459 stop:902 length:444 start_codon:yes stop_codon:yes gene_type:complete
MKQKSIQPARNIPYAEGILMYNGTGATIAANDLVRADASAPTGQCLNMNATVNAGTVGNGMVPLFITKHSVPAGKYGVVLPWAILSNLDTSGTGLNIAAGAPVYLQDSGAYGPGVGTVDRVVGVCLVNHATSGVLFIDLRMGGTIAL